MAGCDKSFFELGGNNFFNVVLHINDKQETFNVPSITGINYLFKSMYNQ
jgi:hypothetical protein